MAHGDPGHHCVTGYIRHPAQVAYDRESARACTAFDAIAGSARARYEEAITTARILHDRIDPGELAVWTAACSRARAAKEAIDQPARARLHAALTATPTGEADQ